MTQNDRLLGVAIGFLAFGIAFLFFPNQIQNLGKKQYADDLKTLSKINSKSYVAYLRVCGGLLIIGALVFLWLLYLFATVS